MEWLKNSETEDNQIKESELQNIVKNIETISTKQQNKYIEEQKGKKQTAESQAKSLSDKIEERKKKLKQNRPGQKEEKKLANLPKKKPIISPVATRTNYHKHEVAKQELGNHNRANLPRRNVAKKHDTEAGQEQSEEVQQMQPSQKMRAKNEVVMKRVASTPRSIQAFGYSKKHGEKLKLKSQHGINTQALPTSPDEEPRFDPDDYTKTATAFNLSTSLSQSLFQRAGSVTGRAGLEDVSFTEKLLVDNTIKNVAKRKGMQVPTRALSCEERVVSQCTFHPELFKGPQKYTNIQPRLLSHFEQQETSDRKIPKNEQVLSTLNRSFQSVILDRPMMRMPLLGIRERLNMTNRKLCKLEYYYIIR